MSRTRIFVIIPTVLLVFALAAWGCSGSDADQPAAAQVDAAQHLSTSGFRVDSPNFQEKVRPFMRIPPQQTCFEGNASPPLTWNELPAGTISLALIGEDADHHTGTWAHWVLYNIPADVTELAGGIPTSTEVLPDGTTQGLNDARNIGYEGPCPPPTIIHKWDLTTRMDPPHRYYFRLYALDAELDLGPGASSAELLSAMEGHILGQANTMGKYTRPREVQGTFDVKQMLTQTAIAEASPTPTP